MFDNLKLVRQLLSDMLKKGTDPDQQGLDIKLRIRISSKNVSDPEHWY
jgi:hypothetical protein